MKKLIALPLAAALSVTAAWSQTSDLVFFTDDGQKFTLLIDGDVKNAAPTTRVVATGIRTESPLVMVRFEDPSIPQMKKPGYFPLGKEYTVMITTNKKGERVLRPTGEAALGTAASAETVKPRPTGFVEDEPAGTSGSDTQENLGSGGVQQTTTVTVVEEGQGAGTTQGVNMNVGVNGVGLNMNVGITDGTGAGANTRTTTTKTTTTTTTTTTTGTTGLQTAKPAPKPAPKPETIVEPYRLPGYTGPIGCAMPMSSSEFDDARKSVADKSFEETRLTLAKQIGRDRCFTTDQVKQMMGVFSFEDSRLDFAKWAYERTHDKGNYYKVNDAFSFSSSIDELNEHIQSR